MHNSTKARHLINAYHTILLRLHNALLTSKLLPLGFGLGLWDLGESRQREGLLAGQDADWTRLCGLRGQGVKSKYSKC